MTFFDLEFLLGKNKTMCLSLTTLEFSQCPFQLSLSFQKKLTKDTYLTDRLPY